MKTQRISLALAAMAIAVGCAKDATRSAQSRADASSATSASPEIKVTQFTAHGTAVDPKNRRELFSYVEAPSASPPCRLAYLLAACQAHRYSLTSMIPAHREQFAALEKEYYEAWRAANKMPEDPRVPVRDWMAVRDMLRLHAEAYPRDKYSYDIGYELVGGPDVSTAGLHAEDVLKRIVASIRSEDYAFASRYHALLREQYGDTATYEKAERLDIAGQLAVLRRRLDRRRMAHHRLALKIARLFETGPPEQVLEAIERDPDYKRHRDSEVFKLLMARTRARVKALKGAVEGGGAEYVP